MKHWPVVLRLLAMAFAAVSVTWGVTLSASVIAAAVGAAIGVLIGERLGRSSLRVWAALGGVVLGVVVAHVAARLLVDVPLLAGRLGPGTTLRAASAIRLGSFGAGATAVLRILARRRPVAVGLELAAVAVAIPLSFAAHRDGVIARPLWLGDWAWARGVDPAVALLAIGGGAVVVLAILLLAEGSSRRAPSAFFALAILTVLAILLLRKVGLPEPDTTGGIGLDGGDGDAGLDAADASRDGGGRGRRRGDGGASDGGADSDGGEDDDDSSADGGGEIPPDLEKESSSGGGDSPMAIVILDDDYSPPSQGYYLRQDAWSELNGTRLVRATRGDVDLDVPDTFPSKPARVPGISSIKLGRTPVHTFIALLVDHPRPFGLETPELLEPAKNPNPTRFKRAYRVTSSAQSAAYKDLFGLRAGDPSWSPEVRAHYLAEPDDPRYAELARSIIDHAPARLKNDPFGKAVAVKLKLDDAFKYSTKHRHAGAADPTADFLFGDRIGYCVHFAHAAVYLWRSLGIPSRVGTGYRVDEDERHGGSSILVRSRDAHAWPELYLEGYGWIVLDIAPKENLDPPGTPVDSDLQRMLGEMARSLPHDPTDTRTSDLHLDDGLARDVALATLLAACAAAILLYVVKVWRRLAPRFARARSLPWIGYRGALDMLSEVGQRRRFGESREAFARRVARIAPSFEALTRLHLRAALGAPTEAPAPERVEQWQTGLHAVRKEIASGVPLSRRAVGLLNPVSFFGSK